MTDRKVLGLIPARGGSKGVPRKNIKTIHGEPLIAYTIKAAREAASIDSVVVSTDDAEIGAIAEESGANVPFFRPDQLATDEAPTEPVVRHALDWFDQHDSAFDEVILLQPTSPARTSHHIDEAWNLYIENRGDSAISVQKIHSDIWTPKSDGFEKLTPDDEPSRRQDRTPYYMTNGAIYITNVTEFLKSGKLSVGETVLYEMNELHSIDVDAPDDLWLAEQIIKRENL